MHTWVLLLALAGCGRFGFDGDPVVADALNDGVIDVPTAPGDPSLVAWYQMEDDPTDGRIDDSAGRDHDATCAVGSTCGTFGPGVRGNALRLAPAQCYRALSTAAVVTPTRFTVTVWVRPETSAVMIFVTKRLAAIYNSWGLRLDVGDVITFESAGPGTPPTSDNALTPPVTIGAWVHLAITWDDLIKRIYLNGALKAVEMPLDVLFDGGEILIGCDDDNGIRFGYVTGLIDDIRVYDRVLSEPEIAALAVP